MRAWWLIIVVGMAGGLLAFGSANAGSNSGPAGRFQIVEVEAHTLMAHGKEEGEGKQHVVIRLDTATGSTAMLVIAALDGRLIEEWQPLPSSKGAQP